MSIKITGFNKVEKDFKKVIEKIPEVVAIEYRKDIVKNLEPSKKTGNLMNSFKIRTGRLKASIVSKLPYAAIQNYGGKIRITDRMRKKMWALYKETGLSVYKAIAITKKTSITIPAKNFTKIDKNSLLRRVERKVNKLLKKK